MSAARVRVRVRVSARVRNLALPAGGAHEQRYDNLCVWAGSWKRRRVLSVLFCGFDVGCLIYMFAVCGERMAEG